jgi:hypothetical protein
MALRDAVEHAWLRGLPLDSWDCSSAPAMNAWRKRSRIRERLPSRADSPSIASLADFLPPRSGSLRAIADRCFRSQFLGSGWASLAVPQRRRASK